MSAPEGPWQRCQKMPPRRRGRRPSLKEGRRHWLCPLLGRYRTAECGSGNIKRNAWRYNKSGPIQRYSCREKKCGKRFIFQPGFERAQKPKWAILDALDLRLDS